MPPEETSNTPEEEENENGILTDISIFTIDEYRKYFVKQLKDLQKIKKGYTLATKHKDFGTVSALQEEEEVKEEDFIVRIDEFTKKLKNLIVGFDELVDWYTAAHEVSSKFKKHLPKEKRAFGKTIGHALTAIHKALWEEEQPEEEPSEPIEEPAEPGKLKKFWSKLTKGNAAQQEVAKLLQSIEKEQKGAGAHFIKSITKRGKIPKAFFKVWQPKNTNTFFDHMKADPDTIEFVFKGTVEKIIEFKREALNKLKILKSEPKATKDQPPDKTTDSIKPDARLEGYKFSDDVSKNELQRRLVPKLFDALGISPPETIPEHQKSEKSLKFKLENKENKLVDLLLPFVRSVLLEAYDEDLKNISIDSERKLQISQFLATLNSDEEREAVVEFLTLNSEKIISLFGPRALADEDIINAINDPNQTYVALAKSDRRQAENQEQGKAWFKITNIENLPSKQKIRIEMSGELFGEKEENQSAELGKDEFENKINSEEIIEYNKEIHKNAMAKTKTSNPEVVESFNQILNRIGDPGDTTTFDMFVEEDLKEIEKLVNNNRNMFLFKHQSGRDFPILKLKYFSTDESIGIQVKYQSVGGVYGTLALQNVAELERIVPTESREQLQERLTRLLIKLAKIKLRGLNGKEKLCN